MTTIRPTWPWAAAGFVLSCYALYVEHKVSHKEEDESFTALCDIEQLGASCRYVLLCLMFVMCRVSVLSSNSLLNLVLFSCSLDHSPFFSSFCCAFFISYSCGLTIKLFLLTPRTHTHNAQLIFFPTKNIKNKQKQKKYRLSIARRTNVVLFWNCSQWSRVGCTQCGVGRGVLSLLDSSTTHLAGSSESCGGQFGRSCFVLLARQVDHASRILHLVPFHPCH
jgi:hypothetical protein